VLYRAIGRDSESFACDFVSAGKRVLLVECPDESYSVLPVLLDQRDEYCGQTMKKHRTVPTDQP